MLFPICPACNNRGKSDPCAFCFKADDILAKTINDLMEKLINPDPKFKIWSCQERKYLEYFPGQIVGVTDEEAEMLRSGQTLEEILQKRLNDASEL